MKLAESCTLTLPDWAVARLRAQAAGLGGDVDAMRLAIDLAGENVRRRSGGPFAALVYDSARGDLLGAGVNRVLEDGLSIAHAEIVALSLAQRALGDWNLARERPLSLVSTCEPCAMCLGAIPWSGTGRLVCGSRQADAEAAGFDEGDKPADWQAALARRGIEVVRDVLRQDANRLFAEYRRLGGVIYNPERGEG